MKAASAFFLLASLVTATDWGQSCSNEVLDPATDVLTADCGDGDGEGTVVLTSIDLTTCLAWNADAQAIQSKGSSDAANLSTACSGCSVYRVLDPIYGDCCGVTRPWMNCTCEGAAEEVSVNLDAYLDNNDGDLTCVE